jgi:hypothetical protein
MSRYVTVPAPPPDPPTVSGWKAWMAAHRECDRIEVEVAQERDGLVRGPVELAVYFLDVSGQTLHRELVEWDADFERFLIEEAAAPSQTKESEILRFELLLSEAFRPVWREVDGGYFDAVLVQLVREGDYRAHPAIQAVLAHAEPGNPSPRRLQETRAFIEGALTYVGGRLLRVRPDPAEADELLARALAAWLDERFSVSRRRAMGMLSD